MSPFAPPTASCCRIVSAGGPAAIAVVELRGPATADFIRRHLQARGVSAANWVDGDVRRCAFVDASGAAIDDVLVIVHAGPPNWRINVCLHGNPWLAQRCAELGNACGLATLPTNEAAGASTPASLEAEAADVLPSLLTYRGVAWLGRQVAALRSAVEQLLGEPATPGSAAACREIADRFEIVSWFTKPLRVVLAGPPNAGKSALANSLAGRPISIVSDRPGTTRDWTEADDDVEGFPLTWIDTAGLREPADEVEQAGAARTRDVLRSADGVVVVLDSTAAANEIARFVRCWEGPLPMAVGLNKADIAAATPAAPSVLPGEWAECAVVISARTGTGLDELRRQVLMAAGREPDALEAPAAWSGRQRRLLRLAADSISHKPIYKNYLQSVAHPDWPLPPCRGGLRQSD